MTVPVLLLAAALTAPTTAVESTTIAVMPLRAVNVPSYVTELLDNTLAVAIGDAGGYRVLNANDINAMLGVERMKDAVGCDDVSCAVDIGGALNAGLIVTGGIGRLGTKLTINLALVNTRTTNVEGRVEMSIPDDENAYQRGVRDAVQELFAKTAKAAATASMARLLVTTEPSGADVVVDGRVIGVSPTDTQVPSGQHRVAAYTDDRFATLEAVEVDQEDSAKLNIMLRPAPMNPYRKWGHVSFWTGFGVGGLLAVIGHVGAARAATDYRGGDLSAHDTNHTLSNVAVAGWAIGATGMATGLVLWLLSPGDGAWASENLAPAPALRSSAARRERP